MNPLALLFRVRVRGFRVTELAAFGCLTTLVLGVYFTKAHAGGETARIGDVDQQIAEEQRRIRLLRAELAQLEDPSRIEHLSVRYLAMAPINPKHETPAGSLMEIARQAAEPGPAAKTGVAKTGAAKTGAVKIAAVKTASAKSPGAKPPSPASAPSNTPAKAIKTAAAQPEAGGAGVAQ